MAGIMVPKSRAEAPVGSGGSFVFPAGSWIVNLDETYVQDLPPWAGTPGRGYSAADGEVISLQFGDARGLDEKQGDPGNGKLFVKFVTRDGDIDIESGPNIPDASWQMQKDAALLTNLALAIGQTQDVEMDGEIYTTTNEGFLDLLRSGGLKDTKVGVVVYHKPWKSKDGSKSGTEVLVREFFTAV